MITVDVKPSNSDLFSTTKEGPMPPITPATMVEQLNRLALRTSTPVYTKQSAAYAPPPPPVLDTEPEEFPAHDDADVSVGDVTYRLYRNGWTESWMPTAAEAGLLRQSRWGTSPMIDELDATEALDLDPEDDPYLGFSEIDPDDELRDCVA